MYDATFPRSRRVPIGYRLRRMPDGSLDVLLEKANEVENTALSLLHHKVLSDYQEARRAVRRRNSQIREGRGRLSYDLVFQFPAAHVGPPITT